MKKSIIALLAVVGIFALSSNSHAVPAFARSNGMECSTCHFQQFPLLNPFGRDFKANGYTLLKSEEKIEGAKLSIPHDLGASIVTKIRYQKTNGDYYYTQADGSDASLTKDTDTGRTVKTNGRVGTNRAAGEFQFPDEAALFLGGRVAENVGFLLEGQLADNGAPFFASFKMPFVYDAAGAKLSVIPFTTDGLGASFGFELLNTGAVRNIRVTEHRKDISAQQYLGTDGAATGVAFVAYHDTGYVNYSLWTPVHGTNDNTYLNYLRVAATPQVAGWDLGAGVQLWSGKTKGTFGEGALAEKKAEAWAVDAQAQGAVGSMPLGAYLTYGAAAKTSVGGTENIFNDNTANDKNALALAAELGVLPTTFVSLAYRTADNGKATDSSDNATAVGIKYYLAQNIQLSLNHAIYSGSANSGKKKAAGDQLSTLMLFASF